MSELFGFILAAAVLVGLIMLGRHLPIFQTAGVPKPQAKKPLTETAAKSKTPAQGNADEPVPLPKEG